MLILVLQSCIKADLVNIGEGSIRCCAEFHEYNADTDEKLYPYYFAAGIQTTGGIFPGMIGLSSAMKMMIEMRQSTNLVLCFAYHAALALVELKLLPLTLLFKNAVASPLGMSHFCSLCGP